MTGPLGRVPMTWVPGSSSAVGAHTAAVNTPVRSPARRGNVTASRTGEFGVAKSMIREDTEGVTPNTIPRSTCDANQRAFRH